jgi:pyrroline-5-carboxylate reductase
VDSNREVVTGADVVFLAVKPQYVAEAAPEARGAVDEAKLVVSIVAGVTLAKLAQQFGTGRLVRVMPNTPCLVGEAAAAYCLGEGASPDDGQLVKDLLSAVGVAIQVEERLLDAVTGLSGSGPAYAFVMIEALADGGVRMGLPRDVALTLAAQTLLGAAKMVLHTHEHPAMLKDRVASPGGTTIAGLQALEERAVRGALIAAVEAATRRSMELGK